MTDPKTRKEDLPVKKPEVSAEDALQASEKRYRSLFEAANDGIFVMDGDRFVECNPKALEMFGCVPAQILNETPDRFSPPRQLDGRDSREKAIELIAEALEGRPQFFEWRHCQHDGTLFDAEVSLSRLELAGKHQLFAIVRDITERKQAEEALRDSETKLHEHDATIRALVETSRDWIWAINLPGIHTYCNPAIEAILGYRPDELVGKPSFDLIHEEDRKMVEAELPKWIAEKRGWNGLVLRWKHKDDSWRYLESNAVPVVDAAGEFVGFRGVDRDITDRRNAQQALQESEERYRSLFEDALDMIHIVDANGIIIDANRTELAKLGYTREEYIGKPLSEVIHPDRRLDTMQAARTVLSGKPVHAYETALMTKSGEPIDVEVSAAPQVRGGEVVASRAIIRDIRETPPTEVAGSDIFT